ncbi:MAG: hypothetical protein GEV06_19670 [Luteitalea sp.]|nr:hypothetical protein [Luteitalea sp.]
MNINDAFPSNYLKASDLGEAQPVVAIDRVELEPVGRSKEMKPVVYFAGKQKGMVLNKTNSKKIAEIAGSHDTDDWHGVQVRLFATEVDFQGETVEAIRVKAPAKLPAHPKPQPEPEYAAAMDDESIPF